MGDLWTDSGLGDFRSQSEAGIAGGEFDKPLTLVDALIMRANQVPHQQACGFLSEESVAVADSAIETMTYDELLKSVVATVAAMNRLAGSGLEQQNILLLCPPGMSFVTAFFASLCAGAVAVPLQPPGRKQEVSRWQHIIADAQPAMIVTVSRLKDTLDDMLAGRQLPVIMMDQLGAQADAEAAGIETSVAIKLPSPDSLALLQYTSGSTGMPKGVRITHGNLAHNSNQIRRRFAHTEHSRGVIWLPPHHDMGLIGGILQPVFSGFPVTLMSPTAFLRRPARWLQAVSHFAATTSGGPNFAYEYCLRRCTDDDLVGLDLSHWRVAFNGAETVRDSTMKRFSERFASCGFKPEAFLPCYGLAEGTLLVACKYAGETNPDPIQVQREALQDQKIKLADTAQDAAVESTLSLCALGGLVDDTQAIIVDPVSHHAVAEDQIGEIWLAGPGIADGYQTMPAHEDKAFGQSLTNGSGAWFRTGDLGFIRQQQLYVTSRLKDLIIIRGANFAPQDIELSLELSHPKFLPSASAAFTVDTGIEERLVVIQELDRGLWSQPALNEAMDGIRRAISNDHGLQVQQIVLVKPTSLPKTPSGKVQRRRCRDLLAAGQLKIAAQWSVDDDKATHGGTTAEPCHQSERTEQRLAWLREYADRRINSQLMDERRTLSPHVLLDFGNQGLLGMQVPESMGGLGLGQRHLNRIIQQLAAIDTSLALFVGLNNVLGIGPIMNAGSPELQQRWLPELAQGRQLAAFALTETAAGSNPNAIQAQARFAGPGQWRLFGEKIWSGAANWAGVINLFARQMDGQGQLTGISAFAVPQDRQGLRQGPEALTMGMRALVQNKVVLDGVQVSQYDLLGSVNQGMDVAKAAMNQGRLVIAAACIGGMQRCAQLMVKYAGQRRVSPGLLLDQPVLQQRLEQLCAAIESLQGLVEQLAMRLDQHLPVAEEAYAACKILATEQFWLAADYLVQCLGGRGYIETNLAPQLLRDARVLRIFEGPTEALANYLGISLLRQSEPLCQRLTQGFLATGTADLQLKQLASQAQQWQHLNYCQVEVGEWLSWQVLHLSQSQNLSLTASKERNLRWIALQIHGVEQRIQQQIDAHEALAPNRLEPTARSKALREEIQTYAQFIGDLNPRAAGEDRQLDATLQSQPATVQPQPVSVQPSLQSAAVAPVNDGQLGQQQVAETLRVERWLMQWVAERLNLSVAELDPQRAFSDLGIDSVLAVELAEAVESQFQLQDSLDPTLAWSYPTIEALARLVVQRQMLQRPATSSNQAPVQPATAETDWQEALKAELASSNQ